MRRSDKQPDRVEISPEQLSAAAIEAEASVVMCLTSLYAYGHAVNSTWQQSCSALFKCWAGITATLISQSGLHTWVCTPVYVI